MKKWLNVKQIPSESDTYFKGRFEDDYKYYKFAGGSYMLWIQHITKILSGVKTQRVATKEELKLKN